MLEESLKSKKETKFEYDENLTREESEKRINILLKIISFTTITVAMVLIFMVIFSTSKSSNVGMNQNFFSAKLKSKPFYCIKNWLERFMYSAVLKKRDKLKVFCSQKCIYLKKFNDVIGRYIYQLQNMYIKILPQL